jgi:ATP-dependent Clp protease protease subunit
MPFWRFIQNKVDEKEVELRIEGDIVSDDDAWFYEWFGMSVATPNKFRNELKEHKGKNITVWIDSYGGDTVAAAGIYNALKEHKGKVICKIDGKAMSAASVIAMAGDEIHMSPLAIMMVHNPWWVAKGEAKDMRHAAEVLDEVKESIMSAYQSKTKRSRSKISELMDNETWMSAKTAVKEGFADSIMYVEEKDGEQVENSFMFSRLAIQNSTNVAIERFFELYNQKLKDNPKEPDKDNKEKQIESQKEGSFLLPESKPETPADGLLNLYKQKIKNNLRRYQDE